MRQHITAILLGTVLAASAQDINTQIQVDRTVEPQEREAVRPLTFLPTVQLPQTRLEPLSLHEYMRASELTTITPLLAPVSYGDTIAVSPYRGYAAIGYFPAYNLGASAGYRIINNHNTRLGARLQFDGMSYKGYGSTNDATYSSNTLNVGVDFNHLFGGVGLAGVSAGYKYSRLGIPTAAEGYHQNVNAFDARATWHGFMKAGSYHAAVAFEHFGFGNGTPSWSAADKPLLRGDYDGAAENRITGRLGIHFGREGRKVNGGLEVMADYLHHSSGAGGLLPGYGGSIYALAVPDWSTEGIIRLTPYYSFNSSRLHGRIGLNADITTGNPGKHFHVAPEVTLDWNPASVLAIEARITGGERLNPLGELYDINQWINPLQVYDRSNVPVDARLTVAIGPFAGASLKLWGGYSMANDWLINGWYSLQPGLSSMFINGWSDIQPGTGDEHPAWRNVLTPTDIKGWLAGVSVGYSWRNYLDIEASAAMAPQRCNRGYYLWRDHARYVIEARATGRPIDRLEITAAYQFRGRRMVYDGPNGINLGNVISLDLGASYRISEPLSVGVRVENLLNHRYDALIGIAAQGIKGLIGLSYKF